MDAIKPGKLYSLYTASSSYTGLNACEARRLYRLLAADGPVCVIALR